MAKISRVHLKTEGYRVHHQQREDCVLVSLGPLGVRFWGHWNASMSDLRPRTESGPPTPMMFIDNKTLLVLDRRVAHRIDCDQWQR